MSLGGGQSKALCIFGFDSRRLISEAEHYGWLGSGWGVERRIPNGAGRSVTRSSNPW